MLLINSPVVAAVPLTSPPSTVVTPIRLYLLTVHTHTLSHITRWPKGTTLFHPHTLYHTADQAPIAIPKPNLVLLLSFHCVHRVQAKGYNFSIFLYKDFPLEIYKEQFFKFCWKERRGSSCCSAQNIFSNFFLVFCNKTIETAYCSLSFFAQATSCPCTHRPWDVTSAPAVHNSATFGQVFSNPSRPNIFCQPPLAVTATHLASCSNHTVGYPVHFRPTPHCCASN